MGYSNLPRSHHSSPSAMANRARLPLREALQTCCEPTTVDRGVNPKRGPLNPPRELRLVPALLPRGVSQLVLPPSRPPRVFDNDKVWLALDDPADVIAGDLVTRCAEKPPWVLAP